MTVIDDLLAFMPEIGAEERSVRAKIRTCRNAASFKATQTESTFARDLCWQVTEVATFWIYRPASIGALNEVVVYMTELLRLADSTEAMEALV